MRAWEGTGGKKEWGMHERKRSGCYKAGENREWIERRVRKRKTEGEGE